eukprot:23944_1
MFSNFLKNKHKSSAEIVLKKKIECLILMGDCILDNFYGLNDEDKAKDIEYQIMLTLNASKKEKKDHHHHHNHNANDAKEDIVVDRSIIRIHNLALYDMSCDGILNGMVVDELYIKARKLYKLACYPLDGDDKMYPIKLLSSMLMNKEIKMHKNESKTNINPTCILSVGFYDLLPNLKYGTPELITESLRKDGFADKYEKIVHQIVDNLGLNLIIVLPFEPHESFTEKQLHFSRDDLLNCMQYMAHKVMQIGDKYQCPVIDLARTLNPFDRKHYGSTSNEPSLQSGKCIVDLIIKILSIWDWNDNNRKSIVYYGQKSDKINIQTATNDKAYRNLYLKTLQARALLLNVSTQNEQEMDLLADLFADDD